MGRSFGYILPDERFGECKDGVVFNPWVRCCCDVETSGVLDVGEIFYRMLGTGRRFSWEQTYAEEIPLSCH